MKKVLVVDDSKTALMMTTTILSRARYAVATPGDGEEGLARALAEPPDAILLDVIMPRMGGFEACQRLRQEAATRDLPIIMVTTRGEPVNVQAGFESGCNDYVTKPIDAVELLAKLRDQLGE